MRSVQEYIKESLIIERFNAIDNQIIFEALQSKVLQELAKQLLDQVNAEKKYNDESGNKMFNSRNKTFNYIFGSKWGQKVAWSEITDSDIEERPADYWNHVRTSAENKRMIKELIKGQNTDRIIIIKDPETNKFKDVIFADEIFHLEGSETGYGKAAGYKYSSYGKPKQSEILNLCTGKDLYIIKDVNIKHTAYYNKRKEREDSKRDMIYMDPESLKAIAKKNQERYKQIIAKNKIDNQHNDKLIDKAKDIIDQAAYWATEVAKNPARYADIISDVTTLTKLIYDKRKYIQSRGKYSGWYEGIDGILPTLMAYINNIRSGSSSNYTSMYAKDIELNKKQLESLIQKCEIILQRIV